MNVCEVLVSFGGLFANVSRAVSNVVGASAVFRGMCANVTGL